MLRKLDDARPFIEEAWAIDGHDSPGRFVDLLVAIGETEWAQRAQADARAPRALGYLSLGEIDAAFDVMRQKIEEHDVFLITGLSAEWWDPLRDDPRFEDMLELLDSKVIHTAAYLTELE